MSRADDFAAAVAATINAGAKAVALMKEYGFQGSLVAEQLEQNINFWRTSTPSMIANARTWDGATVPPPLPTGGVTLTNPPTTPPKAYTAPPIAVVDKGWERNYMALRAVPTIGHSLAMAYMRASTVAGNNISAATGNRITFEQKRTIINERAGYADAQSVRPRAPDVWAMRLLWTDGAGATQESYVGCPNADSN
jgi:hypothetical protein